MYLISDVLKSIDDLVEKYGDPRSKEWLGMSSPYPTIALSIGYVLSIKIGIKLMEKRKPFVLNNVLVAYNAFQVMLSAYILYNFSVHGWMRTGKFFCDLLDSSSSPTMMALQATGWWYYFSKFTEFFDTYFFIIRKKNNQISSLHVIHHTIMPMVGWFAVKISNGIGGLYGVINTFVHVIMYTYYMVAAMGPQYQKYIWWKKYLTIVQLTQFVLIFSHATILLFIDCPAANKLFSYIIIGAAALFFIMFKLFYQEAYIKQESKLQGYKSK